jgi:hypothetical protein
MGNIISDERLYTATLGETSLRVMVYPIDTIGQNISPLCNLDFLNFIWDYLPSYSFLKVGIIAFPVQNRTTILYVQHHRARSDGLLSTVLCEPCARRRRADWYFCSNCARTPECRCIVCVRQPPSLGASAANVFNLVLSPDKFRVTRVTPLIIMPMPSIWTRYRGPECCHASTCFVCWPTVSIPRVGGITSTMPLPHLNPLIFSHNVSFEITADALYALRWDRHKWWCATCDCPLFICDPCFEMTVHALIGI